MDVQLGTRHVKFPSHELQQLVPSNHLLGDFSQLRKQLEKAGYLYLKNFHERAEVLAARQRVLQYITSTGDAKLDDIHLGILNERCGLGCVPFMEGKSEITHTHEVKQVIEGPRPYAFFEKLFDQEAITFDYKWLRAMHKTGFTGAHVDNVYMSRGTDALLTMWTPFSDINPDVGTLAVCEGSNQLESYNKFQDTYGRLDLEASNVQGTGWFTEDPWEISEQFGGTWKTTEYEAGDVLIFTLRTVHMSTVNQTNLARISCDTRWQPKNEAIDPRYSSSCALNSTGPQFGVWAKDKQHSLSNSSMAMDELKKMWGF